MKKNTLKYLVFFITVLLGMGVCFGVLFSKDLGLGNKTEFFLYKLIGLSRRQTFSIGVILSFLSFLPLLYIKKTKNYLLDNIKKANNCMLSVSDKCNYSQQNIISISSYMLLLSLVAVFHFIVTGNHTAFEATTTQDIPFILRLLNPDFLLNDFYTNSVVGSPRLFFSYIVYGLVQLGMSWYTAIYFLKFLVIIVKYPLIFIAMYGIFKKYKCNNLSLQSLEIVKFILFAVCLVYLLQVIPTSVPFGWAPMQTYKWLTPMTLSFSVGLLYNFLSFRNNKLFYSSPIFLLISMLLHPVIGLCHFIITLIFQIPLSFNKKIIFKFGLDFFIGILLPLLFFIFNYQIQNPLSPEVFIHCYINICHPQHYLMSEVFGLQSIAYILLFFIPLYGAIKIKETKLIVLSSLVLTSLICAPLLQFFGTEIWTIKKIAELGPSRFTTYASILWWLTTIIVGVSFFNQRIYVKMWVWKKINNFDNTSLYLFVTELILFIKKILSFIEYMFEKKILTILFFVVLLSGGFFLTYHHPLDYYANGRAKKVIQWIKSNTPKTSTFFVRRIDECDERDKGFFVRVYGNRAIFADYAFPFNEDYVKKFTERFLVYDNSKNFTPSDYACLKKHYEVDFLILPKKEQIDGYEPVFSSYWLVYDMSQFKLTTPCHKRDLSHE